jgi:hypothetical protein
VSKSVSAITRKIVRGVKMEKNGEQHILELEVLCTRFEFLSDLLAKMTQEITEFNQLVKYEIEQIRRETGDTGADPYQNIPLFKGE